tara:strand:- start:27614 stop:27766 length:153 start_codon:yes stop_codon:yes gene_type:complete
MKKHFPLMDAACDIRTIVSTFSTVIPKKRKNRWIKSFAEFPIGPIQIDQI